MPSLKDLKNRIASVKSTRKITSAMKMVAGSKLRRAQESVEAARPYAQRMQRLIAALVADNDGLDIESPLLAGTGSDKVVLLLVVTSDRGLCGGFNSYVVREARRLIRDYEAAGKTVKLLCVGRKGRDLLRRDHAAKIVLSIEDIGRKRVSFAEADHVTGEILKLFQSGEFDICQVVFNRFKSAISQILTVEQLLPFTGLTPQAADGGNLGGVPAMCEFEPNKSKILETLLPRALAVAVYGALLENAAGEQGARMAAMDNATRNAGDMINKLTLNYNRSRQACITKELIEIISGAEAV